MQRTLSRKLRFEDALYVGVNVYAAIFAIGLGTFGMISPWLALTNHDWTFILVGPAFGAMGYLLGHLEWKVFSELFRDALERRRIQRNARVAAAARQDAVLKERPEMYSPVRVLEATWTPFGTLLPHDIGTVLPLELDDDSLVLVRWTRGENITDWRNLAEG